MTVVASRALEGTAVSTDRQRGHSETSNGSPIEANSGIDQIVQFDI